MNFKLKSTKKFILISSTFGLLAFNYFLYSGKDHSAQTKNRQPRLYWFIPDGLRADKHQFNIFEWAEKGQMPALKKMMDSGCWGYSWPVFPGHTPSNFATLMTGVSPSVHGITDGSMRLSGYPLGMVSLSGFSSTSKKVPALWSQLENAGYEVTLQSVPGSTPPEIFHGNVIKGRWGNWGVEFPAIIFQDKKPNEKLSSNQDQNRLFYIGSELTKFIDSNAPTGWSGQDYKNEKVFEVNLSNWDAELYGLIVAGKTLLLSQNKKEILASVDIHNWSDWIPIRLKYDTRNDHQKNSPKKSELENRFGKVDVDTFCKVKLVLADQEGSFRIRVIYDNLNEHIVYPPELSEDLRKKVGHFVDYPDSFPPQLIYFNQDKQTFLDEAKMSFVWHQKVVPYLKNDLNSNVVIHSIYTPNQMLTSRWWLPFVDQFSFRFLKSDEARRTQLMDEIKGMYLEVDKILAEIIKNKAENEYVVLSSDHGVLPLYKEVRLNNLFAQKGWLKIKKNEQTSNLEIDWEKTKVVYLQSNNIYIHAHHLSGPYSRESSPEYKKLRDEVKKFLLDLKDPENQAKIFFKIWENEQAAEAGLMSERSGDLILATTPQYGWTEDVTTDGEIFVGSLKGGYKQGVWPESAEGMLTPFVILGPDIKQGCQLAEPISHIDQFATIAKILNIESPYKIQGKVIESIFQ